MAGRPGSISAQGLVGLKVLIASLSAALGIALAAAVAGGAATVLLGAAVTLLGFRLPNIWPLRRISARQNEIRALLPDALELITVSAEAGLAFEAVLARFSTRMTGALAEEFDLMLREIGLGKTRRQALRDLAERSDVEEVRTFVAMIVHPFFMRMAIDVLFVDAEGRVLETRRALPPWRLAAGGKAVRRTLELPDGTIGRLDLQSGDRLIFGPTAV